MNSRSRERRWWRHLSLPGLLACGSFTVLLTLYGRAAGAEEGSAVVVVWWAALSAVGVANITGWAIARTVFLRRRSKLPPHIAARRRWQVVLSGLYVVGCAIRSFFPKADVQRICLVDSFVASVFVGRTIATIAEVSFVAQWALLLDEFARETGSRLGHLASRLALPLILFAEVCSWYAVLTTSYLGNALEQSTWTLTAAVVVLGTMSVYRRCAPRHRPFLGGAIVMGIGYVLFMVSVDVPMYIHRFQADSAAGREYFSLGAGLRDVLTRWVVTFRLDDWRSEIPWMSLYFSIEVWLSIAFINAPRVTAASPSRR